MPQGPDDRLVVRQPRADRFRIVVPVGQQAPAAVLAEPVGQRREPLGPVRPVAGVGLADAEHRVPPARHVPDHRAPLVQPRVQPAVDVERPVREVELRPVVDVEPVPVHARHQPGRHARRPHAQDRAVAHVRALAQALHVGVHPAHGGRGDVAGVVTGQVACLVPGRQVRARRRGGQERPDLPIQPARQQVGGDGPDGDHGPAHRRARRPARGDVVVLRVVDAAAGGRGHGRLHGGEPAGVGPDLEPRRGRRRGRPHRGPGGLRGGSGQEGSGDSGPGTQDRTAGYVSFHPA